MMGAAFAGLLLGVSFQSVSGRDIAAKESVSHGDHKPQCCTLPEEALHKEKGSEGDKKAA